MNIIEIDEYYENNGLFGKCAVLDGLAESKVHLAPLQIEESLGFYLQRCQMDPALGRAIQHRSPRRKIALLDERSPWHRRELLNITEIQEYQGKQRISGECNKIREYYGN